MYEDIWVGGKAWLNLDSFTPKEELPILIGYKAKFNVILFPHEKYRDFDRDRTGEIQRQSLLWPEIDSF